MSDTISGPLPLWDYRNFTNTGLMGGGYANFGNLSFPAMFSGSTTGSSANVDTYEAYKKKQEEELAHSSTR